MSQEWYTSGNRHVKRRPEQISRQSPQTPKKQSKNSVGQNSGRAYDVPKKNTPTTEYRFTSGRVQQSAQNSQNNVNRSRNRGKAYSDSMNTSKKVRPARNPDSVHSYTDRRTQNRHLQPTQALTPRQEQILRRAERKEQEWQANIVRVRGGVDKVMLGLILILVCLGTIMVFSASYPSAMAEGREMLYYGKRQIFFVCFGLGAMLVASLVPYRVYRNKVAKILYAVTMVMLVLVLVFGVSEGEAKRWLDLKIISIQPSEIMKFSLIIMMAWYVDTYKKQIENTLDKRNIFKYHVFYPGLLIGSACALVLLEKHLSGTIIIFMIGWLVILVGGCRFTWTFPCYALAGGTAAGVFLLLNPYALKRITTHMDENANILDEAYQTAQGLYAIGSGGLFGVGLGESRQKYSYVSAAHTDFIFSIWCEEFGFIGGLFLVLLYIAFIWRGYVIASRAPDTFSCLTAFGITTHVGLQAVLNMCVVTKIMFNTGISLPFFSYGGSSLVVLLGEMGVLLSISRQYYMKEKDLLAKQTRQELGME